ncbi:MAG: hypothetical protein GEEBNDBF_01800 [bacterium]|nr:hypothetical protein [bacterium]
MPETAPVWPPLGVALLTSLLAFGFGLVPFILPRPDRYAHWLVGFACGAVLGLSIWHLLPHAVEGFHGEPLAIWEVSAFALVGAGLLYFIEHVLLPHQHHVHQIPAHDGHGIHHIASGHEVTHDHSHCAPDAPQEALEEGDLCQVCDIGFYSVASFIGLSMHSFVDGLYIALFSAFSTSFLPYLGILLHKLGEAFVLTTIFHLAGYQRRRTTVILAVFLCMTPLGTLLGSEAIHNLTSQMGYLSALAAGGFLYIAGHGLLPALWSQPRHRLPSAIAVLLGIGFIYVAQTMAEPGGHAHHQHGAPAVQSAQDDHDHDHAH